MLNIAVSNLRSDPAAPPARCPRFHQNPDLLNMLDLFAAEVFFPKLTDSLPGDRKKGYFGIHFAFILNNNQEIHRKDYTVNRMGVVLRFSSTGRRCTGEKYEGSGGFTVRSLFLPP